MTYTPSGDDAKEERAEVVKVHPDVGGDHYTIRTMGKDGKEKNTDAAHISKVYIYIYIRLLTDTHTLPSICQYMQQESVHFDAFAHRHTGTRIHQYMQHESGHFGRVQALLWPY